MAHKRNKAAYTGKEKSALVCPKCLKPYKPAKTLVNLFGVFNYGFKCKWCGYEGIGPIKLVKK